LTVAQLVIPILDPDIAAQTYVAKRGLEEDAFTVAFDDGVEILRVTETGIESPIVHIPESVALSALDPSVTNRLTPPGSVVPLDESIGWAFAVHYQNTREVAFGIRNDGTVYPAPPTIPTPVATPVTIHGDSIAEGWATNLGTLPTALSRTVTVDGIGGQTGAQIAARQGGAPALLTVANDTIPASGGVAVSALTVGLLDVTADTTKSRVGSLAGVKGTLSVVRSGGVHTYTFTRTTAGTAIPCPPGTPFVTGTTSRTSIPVLIQGRNDIGAGVFRTPLDTLLANIEKELKYSANRGRAILLSVLPREDQDRIGNPYRDRLIEINDAYRTTFPTHFVDWGAYLRSDAAFAAAGITKTAQDTTDITDGVTPASFRNDILHPNANAYKAANVFLASVITSRD
jgi:hypothetical protein